MGMGLFLKVPSEAWGYDSRIQENQREEGVEDNPLLAAEREKRGVMMRQTQDRLTAELKAKIEDGETQCGEWEQASQPSQAGDGLCSGQISVPCPVVVYNGIRLSQFYPLLIA